MIETIANQAARVREICLRHPVRRLELFGSAADGTFNPETSDLDFLVQFETISPAEYYEAYFGLVESLEALFDRRVDLVDVDCLRNPYFVRGVNESRRLVYEARSAEVPG